MFLSLYIFKFFRIPKITIIIPKIIDRLPTDSASKVEPLPTNKSRSEVISVCPHATHPKPKNANTEAKIPQKPVFLVVTLGNLLKYTLKYKYQK